MATATHTYGDLGLSIIGLGTQYPANSLGSDAMEQLSRRFYPSSPALDKVLRINRATGINARSSIETPDHPLVNQDRAPTIAELHSAFLAEGVPLAVAAAGKALREAGVEAGQISHVVSATCTDSASPGFDHFVARGLGLDPKTEKVLLHGISCSGGLAALRTGANLALACTALGRLARVLCLTLEISTLLVRSELDSINERQEVRIGACLFSDCASAVVLSNGMGPPTGPAVYDLLGWHYALLPGTENHLSFDVHPSGWKIVLTSRVPELAMSLVTPAFAQLKASLPQLLAGLAASGDFDWAMHPGGARILTAAEESLGISPAHMRASYDVYVNHGNSSSATIYSVLDRLRSSEMDLLAPDGRPRQHVIGCGFGPGIGIEMCLLRRNMVSHRGRLDLGGHDCV